MTSLSPFAVFEGAVRISIDIKPGSYPNSINPRSNGKIPVAILSSSTFDAASIDRDSLRFGALGTEESLAFCNPWPEDVDGDGYADMICHFNTAAANFGPASTQGILQAKTKTGIPLFGVDSVRIVP